MFINTISWHEFITTAIYILIAYYAITSLLLYQQEIKSWLSNRTKNTIAQPPSESKPKSETSSSFMGDIHEDNSTQPRITSSPSDEIIFNETPQQEELNSDTPFNNEVLIIQSVADLLQEIKTLTQLAAADNTNKAESITLIKTLLQRYPHLQNTTYQESINQVISYTAQQQFHLIITPSEINSWWHKSSNEN